MAYRFDNSKKTVHIDIEEIAFDVPYNADTIKRMQTVGKRMQGYADSEAIYQDTAEDMAYFVRDCIDMLLGDGASERIFDGREPDYIEAVDVANYIVRQIAEAGKNRSQRREKTPKKSGGKRYRGKYK